MKNSLETKLGVFVVLVIFAAWAIVETLGSADVFSHGYHISAQFDTAQDLKIGDRVKMAGVEIGRVDNISLSDEKVVVTMKLKTDAVVRTDSKAAIKFTGLMGQNFVAIGFGSPGAKSFTGDKIDNLVGPLTDFFKQNSGPITATIANVKNISSQIAAGQGTVGKLIYNDELYASAMSTVTNLQDTVASAKLVVDNVNSGQGTIGKLLTDETLYRATTSSMTNLNGILSKINSGNGTVGKLVNDQEFYKNAKLSLQKLDKAADGLEDQGPLSVLGIMANNLF